MNRSSSHILAVGLTVLTFGAVVILVRSSPPPPAEVESRVVFTGSMFGGTPQRNMVNLVDRGVPDDWAVERKDRFGKITQASMNILWMQALGSRSNGGPIVSGGRIFVGTNNHRPRDPLIQGDRGVLMCFRQSDGQFLWQSVHKKLETGQVNDWPMEGIASHPAVEGEFVWYVSNRCELICARAAGLLQGDPKKLSADIVWRLDMIKELKVFPHNLAAGSPLIVNDLVYVVTGNGVDENHSEPPAPGAPSFLAVDKRTGRVVWKDNSPGKDIMHGQWSNPVYAETDGGMVIFPGGDGWLRAFEPRTGKLIWKFDANPKGYKYELGGNRHSKSDFIGAPVVWQGKLYIGTGQDPEHYEGEGQFWCIDLTKAGDVSAQIVVDGKAKANPNSAVVWHFGGPYSKEDAAKHGRDYPFCRTMSTAAVHDGLCYIADLPGYFYCFDAHTGKLCWEEDLKAGVWASPYWVDNKVYIGTEDGEMWIFRHGKEKKLIRRIEMDSTIHNTPVVANGVLYVMTETKLYAIARK